MKQIFTLIVGIIFVSIVVNAQKAPPYAFSYKATIYSSTGTLVTNKCISFKVSILQGSTIGVPVFIQTFKPTTNSSGQIDLIIGQGSSTSLSSIDWAADIYYLKTEVDVKGGTSYLVISTTQLLSVPYALYAGKAGNGFSGNYNDLINKPFSITSPVNNQLLKYNSTTGKWENWTPNFGSSSTETDPIWTAASVSYYTKTNLQTSGGSQVHFNNITNKPTTLVGYGITNAMSTSHVANGITNTNISNWNTAFSWGKHAGLYKPISYVPAWVEITSNPFSITSPANNQLLKYNSTTGKWENWTPNFGSSYTETDPIWTAVSANYYTKTNMQTSGGSQLHFNNITNKPTTLAGYGITDAFNGSWAGITGKPTTLTGYGITDAFNGAWASLTGKPITLTGYGITDAMSTSHPANGITSTYISNWNSAFSWGNHSGLYRPISYVPAWSEITSNPFSITTPVNNQMLKYNSTSGRWENWTPDFGSSFTETDPIWTAASTGYYTKTNLQTSGGSQVHFNNITNKPTTLAGYGITDASNGTWSSLTGKPTTLSGYGITDAMSTSHAANGISSTEISNWNVAYGWGDHSGLYRPKSWVPTWTDISGKPFRIDLPKNGDLLMYDSGIDRWINWSPNYLTSYTETDPVFMAWDKSTGIGITAAQVSDFQTGVTNNSAVVANTAKRSYPLADETKLAGIATGAEVNVNADWNASSGDANILNKPVLATVATTGKYDDLTGTPTIPSQYTDAMADMRVVAGITDKVDKITGKGLSTNDYTNSDASKLAGIAAGAEVNVNADWNAISGDAQILNKPNYSVQSLSGTTPAWNANSGINATLTLTGNTSITLSNLVAGMSGNLTIINATSVYTLTFSGYTNRISQAVYIASDQVGTSGGSKIDVFSWYYDGTRLIWNGTLDYK